MGTGADYANAEESSKSKDFTVRIEQDILDELSKVSIQKIKSIDDLVDQILRFYVEGYWG